MKKIISVKPWLFSLGAVLLLSAYPLWMGVKILAAQVRDGYIRATDYPKYVIPYTPIAIALIACVALLPLAMKYCKKLSLLVISVLGVGLFLLAETGFERVMVFDTHTVQEERIVENSDTAENSMNIETWQYTACYVTPERIKQWQEQAAKAAGQEPVTEIVEVQQEFLEEVAARYTPAFKIHFYLIAILIVLAVLGMAHGFSKKALPREKIRPLVLQAVSTAVFIGLCVFACFTAFYRTGGLAISALSAWLMSLFFVVFGVTAGTYTGGLLYGKRPALSRLVPSLVAIATVAAMYVGELILLGGKLYSFGGGALCKPLGACPLALVDFAVIALSGAATYGLLRLVRKKA